ncbi:hypothetical protein [Candidatus Methylopumilus turicensis]|uniref:Uncharacterized protein n=1 Tax=Candidatus Methylopumilus turicensis TaxID=1581680 RepID=A0A0B7J121_9PROT|nr:hypothetical protein [Candidatus Methylopumilus turicensis]CEN56473.1 protein of unknown function [Candidatus Methylopumilus turicensis]
MTIYNHTLTLQDVERISLSHLINDAINKFKEDHPDGSPPVPWVWESILDKLRNAEIRLLSSNNFGDNGNSIFMHLPNPN